MNPTAGSFTINPRLQRHFATFAVSFPSQVPTLLRENFMFSSLNVIPKRCTQTSH
jgi:dynein heavy chain